ncbi:MAG: 3-isopropylmalate dehydrogenase [Methanobacterium sp.]|uniref:isocitrate/isopropylmalate family dehydrogenase n=1 Tax=Methanobacterium sp. TaxID=2164 RepID=UPI0024AB36B9|nr:isocitrate/isopropylmalate family dehydrogenase [Methanobacterium sp.]MDI3550147.1 3-isopropylmalate dehydrogenase [Methanobacterium sp.]
MYKIAVIPGDGIGKEVMEATFHVLEAIDVEFDYTFADAGDEYLEKTGVALPQETIDIVKASQACLFGAAGESAADVIVKMRQELDLYANLRPVKSYPGTKSLFGNLDFVIVRENTEGLYIGMEEETEEGATALRVITRKASEKICKYAFEYAKTTGRKKVTAVHKANVLKKTDGLFKETFYKVAEDYPDMELDDLYVDATAMFFITKPEMFDVIVTTNLFGDILSDEGAGLVGGLGLIPSANIGDKQGLFEPVHGSAPGIAGKGIANPSAMILSAVLMLDYLEENEAARKIENALVDVLAEGKVVTPDMGGNASTMEMAAEIRSKLENN